MFTQDCLIPKCFVTRRVPFLPLFFLLLFGFQLAHSQDSPPNAAARIAPEVTTLELGTPVECELAGGEKHAFRLALKQGHYASVVVDQRGVDVSVRLSDVGGKLIAEFDRESRNQGQEKLEFVAESTGDYKLEVAPTLRSARPGRYEIRLSEVHAATDRERSQFEAIKALYQALRLYDARKVDPRPLAEQSLKGFEALGVESQDFARVLNLMANLQLLKSDLDNAEVNFKRALEMRERLLGPEHPDVASTYLGMGRLYHLKGDNEKAETLYRRALTMREAVLDPAHVMTAMAWYSIAGLFSDLKNYPKAEETWLRVVSMLEKAAGDDSQRYSEALHNLAFTYDTTGDFTKAEDWYRRELASREKANGRDSIDAVYTLQYIARVYFSRGEYDDAEAVYQRALDISEKLNNERFALTARASLANIYSVRGDYERSRQINKQILEQREKEDKPDQYAIANTLLNLGVGSNNLGDYVAAENDVKRALSIIEKNWKNEDYYLRANGLNILAGAYLGQSNYAAAEEACGRALKIYEKINGPNHPSVAAVLTKLGRINYFKGDPAAAEPLFQRALAIDEKLQGPNGPGTAGPLNALAQIYVERGDLSQAIEFQKRANAVDEHKLALALATGSERNKLNYLAASSSSLNRNVTLNVRNAPANPQAAELAAMTILRFKGRVLDSMTDSLSVLRRRFDPEDQALLDQFNQTTSQLAWRVLNSSQRTPAAEDQAQIAGLEEKRGKLEEEISRRSAEFRAQKQVVTLDAIRRVVPDGAALIEFAVYRPFDPKSPNELTVYGEGRYVVYVIRNQGDVRYAELGTAKEIDSAIDSLRQALRDPERKDVKRLSRAVDEKVMKPVRGLTGDATQLLISPDGGLNLIPFAALVDEQGHYLLERYAFNYVTSGRDLLRLQVRRDSKSGTIVIADPAFGEPALIASRGDAGRSAGAGERAQLDYSQIFFGPLPGVGGEVRALKQLLPQATFLTKEQATKAALKRVSGPRILHIATHGFFLQNDPPSGEQPATQTKDQTRLGKWVAQVENPLLRSGLALAGANQARGGNNDGVLTAFEATGLDLWGTKLVVLSACDTGLGEVKNGDGVYGLRRALVLAGSESQMMSLWAVSDRSTRDLIVGYYTTLERGAGRSEALRQVQLGMLHSKSHNHPYYWAGFILSGQWTKL
ncbi:MAG: CHAT domain-containing protein [Pyrinomonadaceae bacterium]|nr:CHAT domain-containing protein [Pyrinomonadaceae bacterium]